MKKYQSEQIKEEKLNINMKKYESKSLKEEINQRREATRMW